MENLNLPVYQRGTSITRETTMLRERAQAISIFVLRNLLLYSGTVWTPLSQSWYGEAKLKAKGLEKILISKCGKFQIFSK